MKSLDLASPSIQWIGPWLHRDDSYVERSAPNINTVESGYPPTVLTVTITRTGGSWICHLWENGISHGERGVTSREDGITTAEALFEAMALEVSNDQ